MIFFQYCIGFSMFNVFGACDQNKNCRAWYTNLSQVKSFTNVGKYAELKAGPRCNPWGTPNGTSVKYK